MYRQESVENTDDKFLVMLIDNEEICISAFSMMLSCTKYSYIAFQDSRSAIDYLYAHPGSVDAIVLDLYLDEIGGIDLLRLFTNDDRINSIPIIVQTGHELANNSDITQNIRYFISKPYTKIELIALLDLVAESSLSYA